MKNLYLIVLLFFLSTLLHAQEEIETSPDQYETPSPTPKDVFQIENRFTIQDNRDNSRSLILPSTNWKYGITDRVEAIIVTDLVFDKTPDSITNGLQPLKLGLKVKLWDGRGILPDAALSLQVAMPKLASKQWQATYFAPNVRLLLKNKITEGISAGFNFGSIWDGETPAAQFFYSFSPKYKLSKKFECFIESYGYLRQSATAENWLDGGLMYLITNDIQAEISGGYEISKSSGTHSYFGLAGLAFRI